MQHIDLHEAASRFPALLQQVRDNHERFLICRNGEPIAKLVPYKGRNRLQPHPEMKNIQLRYDPTEPLNHDEWP
jgi:prevent-host-death family protein